MMEKIIHELRSIRCENFESSAENGVDFNQVPSGYTKQN